MLFVIYFFIGFGVSLSINGSDELHSTASSHCFKRISGGERLIGYDVTRIIERNTVEECEEECNTYKCTHFSFGNVTGRNGTCELTTDREISRTQDSNFDLYQRTDECAEGKPTGYEKGVKCSLHVWLTRRSREIGRNSETKNRIIVNGRHHHGDRRLYLIQACYRRIITGKRLHERFIRHSLPCNSLQACQHQCSIEKHFTCQGFNIRLDPARVGRGICELSSVITTHLDPARDFIFDPEFAYYERDHDNGLPNCGHFNPVTNSVPPHDPEENTVGYQPPTIGGPYYGGDSYGPWSTGHGTVDHGPWGSHGYGSGFYESNNPSRGPAPSFHPDTPAQRDPYAGYGFGFGYGSGSQRPQGPHAPQGPPRRPGPFFFPNNFLLPGPYGQGGGSRNGFSEGGSPQRGPGPLYPSGFGQQGSQSGYGSGHGYGYGYGYGINYGGVSQSHGFTGGNNRGPGPYFQPNSPGHGYGLGGGSPSFGSHGVTGRPGGTEPYGYGSSRPYSGEKPTWSQGPSAKYPVGDKRYDRPNRIPTYIIIDADARGGHGAGRPDYQPYRPSNGYLSTGGPPVLPPPRPLPPPPSRPAPPQPPRHPPPPYPFVPGAPDKFGISTNAIGREVCFRREHPGYKLNTNTVKGMYETSTVLDCEAMCTSSPFKCTGYSFRYSSSGTGPNCLLTDFTSLTPETHLLPDRSCDVYFKMGTCMESERVADTECFLKVATNRKLNPSKLVKMLTVSEMSDCELACLGSGFFTCRSFSFRHGPPIIGEPVENCFLSDWPISALTHLDFIPLANHEIYERGSFGHGCELDAGPPHHIGPRPPFTPYPNIPQVPHAKEPWAVSETWRHFTVSGWPCRRGTECELNPQAGFWACEVEGGDRAQWDYCCRPKHSCGFSRGYHYPWCYVGEAGPDQWRPCSEFYYPEFGNRYPYKPVQSDNPHPDDSFGPPRGTRPWNFGSEEFGPPSYWPISYIYAEPPPNETYIWDPEEQLFYHQHDEHYEFHAPEHHREDPEDSPRIRFKPCGNRHPYPRAIIQKLDLKNIPKAGNPEEQLKKDEKPRVPKAESEPALGFSPENRDKKNSQDFFPSTSPTVKSLNDRESNGTDVSLNKTKEVIKEVEKIIMESSTEAEPEKNESLKKVETKNPGFFSLSLLEKQDFWN